MIRLGLGEYCDFLYLYVLINISAGGASCVKATIYATSPAGLPSALNYNCRMSWEAYTIYRELPATAVPMTTSIGPLGPASSKFTVTPTTVTMPTTTATSNTSTTTVSMATSSPTSPQAQVHSNKAWIAGAVIGAIFGIPLVTAAIYRWRRRRRSGQKGKAVELDEQNHSRWQAYPHFQQYHEKDSDGHLVELPSTQPATELPSSRYPAELETNGYR